MSSSQPPGLVFAQQRVHSDGFLREGRKPASANTRPPTPPKGLAQILQRGELGIAAGLQDRVAQSYGGLTFMDFGPATADILDTATAFRAALGNPDDVTSWRRGPLPAGG